VQVKTTGGQSLLVSAESETPSAKGEREWFILVALDEHDPDRRPTFYVVPRNIIAAFIYLGTRHRRPDVDPGPGARRHIKPRDFPSFCEAWHLLNEDPDEVPWMIEPGGGFWQWAEAVKLPSTYRAPVLPSPGMFAARGSSGT